MPEYGGSCAGGSYEESAYFMVIVAREGFMC